MAADADEREFYADGGRVNFAHIVVDRHWRLARIANASLSGTAFCTPHCRRLYNGFLHSLTSQEDKWMVDTNFEDQSTIELIRSHAEEILSYAMDFNDQQCCLRAKSVVFTKRPAADHKSNEQPKKRTHQQAFHDSDDDDEQPQNQGRKRRASLIKKFPMKGQLVKKA